VEDYKFKKHITVLDEIIREIPQFKRGSDDNSGTQTLIVESESGEILEELPLLKFFKKLRFFEINKGKVIFNVDGPTISVSYLNSGNPFVLSISYNAKIANRSVFQLVRSIYKAASPVEGINNHLREAAAKFIFERRDFVTEFKKYESELELYLNETALKCGLEIQAILHNNLENLEADAFISCEHEVITKTKDAQVVEIQHNLALTLIDSVKLKLSGIKDVKTWAKHRLDQFTNNAIIERNYAEVLINMEDSVIKRPMQEACRHIGYELKQLITVPGLEIEKFYFETNDNSTAGLNEYSTKDPRLKISLNIIVDGRLDLHNEKTKAYIKPGFDIIAGMKRNVVEYAKIHINEITPDECFTQQFIFEETLLQLIHTKLKATYGFKELSVLIKFLENDLSKRLSLLQEKPMMVELSADWDERRYALWFRILGVSPNGWYRFRTNNYKTTEEELNDIARMVKNGMESAILRTGDLISGKVIVTEFKNIQPRVRHEFGLDISIHDFNEALSDDEELYVQTKKMENKQKINRNVIGQQSETNQLAEYYKLKESAIKDEESEEVIKKIDEKITAAKEKDAITKQKFLNQKTDVKSLLSNNDSTDNGNAG
jgi:hypothetical protein